MLRCKSCLKTIETNKAEFKDANEDKAESSNDTHVRDDDHIHAHKYFWWT